VKTSIVVKADTDGAYTEVIIKTTDRPGLLTDIVNNLKDINVNVISAEVNACVILCPRYTIRPK